MGSKKNNIKKYVCKCGDVTNLYWVDNEVENNPNLPKLDNAIEKYTGYWSVLQGSRAKVFFLILDS